MLDAALPWQSRAMCLVVAASMLLTMVGRVNGGEVRSGVLVIQGRITAIDGDFVMVKTPDGHPGGPGGHSQFVLAGPSFKVDVSHARILLPDGTHTDRLPLAVDERVLLVMTGPEADSTAASGVGHGYVASMVERIVQNDRIITH